MMDPVEQRFEQLLSLVLDGVGSEAEREEFARLAKERPHLIVGQVETIFTHSLLQWQSGDISEFMALERAARAQDESLAAAVAMPARYASRYWGWAAAVVLCVAVGAAAWHAFRNPAPTDLTIAEIVEPRGVTWADDSTALSGGKFVVPGRLQTNAGIFTLKFHSGPMVHVVGPATIDVESDLLVRLDRGQATTRVPDSIKGFAIRTPIAKVVDQGTEFGVAARDDGRTDVIVFEGSVNVQETAGASPQPKSLIRGEAARIDRQGSIDRIMQVGRDSSGRWWTADRPAPGESVIKLVRDNIPPSDGSKYFCYQITLHGLADDVYAYADHPHQWNGLTAAGLPDFLRGADFVKTFNDYRYLNDFEMVVELSRSANLYVFADNRVPAPQWLQDQFADTGVDVGLDEGPWEGILDDVTHVGGGRSIDNVFSVWHRRCVDLSPVTLGYVGEWGSEGQQGRAMYGIAATPLDVSDPTNVSPPGSDRL